MTFKTVVPRLAARSDDELGLFLVDWVMQNRLDHDRVYKQGEVADFCNKEMNRVYGGLEGLTQTWRDPPTADELVDKYVERRLTRKHKFRDVTSVNYVYDVLKGMYLHLTGDEPDKIQQTGVFLVNRLRRTAVTRPEPINEYQWQRESIRQEYVRILTAMKNRLSDETGLIYDMFDK